MVVRYLLLVLWSAEKYNLSLSFLMAEYLSVTGLLAWIVARERFLYVFVKHPFRQDVPLYEYHLRVVAGTLVVAVYSFLPYLITSLNQVPNVIYYALITIIPWQISIAMLAYYVYQTRTKVQSKFSDHRSNVRIGFFLVLFSNLIVLRACFFETHDGPYNGLLPHRFELFFFYFASMFKTSYTITELFLDTVLISGFDIDVGSHEKTTRTGNKLGYGIASNELSKGETLSQCREP
ncbi:hypothetical protein SARC_10129 [Sphaeroforma arctica JP610]|uniref:Uncharacterized protein n=1 Tax=Sphaeroforma arctica JP610 TaxID=667725 RepID=A0A0L0FKU7_9EUKA|nr:hypothetical protein SARC_10129 [Sphaeroforma arctica JP610]KNC77409.1 hypothetical protein SARC_10129 [Sphaeroforma arctica JP610]|eukprot:XP_014151311.1 hypothetical protein SARC_10129 [Sphaeroforma arctica JP610]